MACSYAAALSSKIKMYKNARIHTLIKTVSQYGTSRPATTFQFSMFGTGIRCRVSLADPRSAIRDNKFSGFFFGRSVAHNESKRKTTLLRCKP